MTFLSCAHVCRRIDALPQSDGQEQRTEAALASCLNGPDRLISSPLPWSSEARSLKLAGALALSDLSH